MAKRMSFRTAMDLVPDDLPDGAFFAMAHEMAGLDYGDGFDEINFGPPPTRKQRADRPVDKGERVTMKPAIDPNQSHKPFLCCDCGARFRLESGARNHWRDRHGNRAVAPASEGAVNG